MGLNPGAGKRYFLAKPMNLWTCCGIQTLYKSSLYNVLFIGLVCIYVRCTLKSNKDLIALSQQLQQILIKISLGGPKSLRIIDIRTSNFVFVWKGEKCWMWTGMSISLKVSKKECKVSKPALPRQTNQKVVTSQTSHTNDFLSKQTGWGLFLEKQKKWSPIYLICFTFRLRCLVSFVWSNESSSLDWKLS